MDIIPPVCPLLFMCTVYATSTYAYNALRESDDIHLLSFNVIFIESKHRFTFFQSSSVILDTHFIKNDIANSKSGPDLFMLKINVATTALRSMIIGTERIHSCEEGLCRYRI